MFKINSKERLRNFAFVLYEDSAPSDWEERLLSLHIPGCYIKHDLDFEGDKPKKSHIHVLIKTSSRHSIGKIKSIVEYVGGLNSTFTAVFSAQGYARYLCHLDNPEKHVYDFNDVKCMCGFDYINYIFKQEDNVTIVTEIIKFCKENDILSYSDLVDYCIASRPDWLKAVYGYHGRAIREYMKSKNWTVLSNWKPRVINKNES